MWKNLHGQLLLFFYRTKVLSSAEPSVVFSTEGCTPYDPPVGEALGVNVHNTVSPATSPTVLMIGTPPCEVLSNASLFGADWTKSKRRIDISSPVKLLLRIESKMSVCCRCSILQLKCISTCIARNVTAEVSVYKSVCISKIRRICGSSHQIICAGGYNTILKRKRVTDIHGERSAEIDTIPYCWQSGYRN